MPAWIVTLIGYVLGGAGILSFVIFLIQRHDQKKGLEKSIKDLEEYIENREKDIKKQFKRLERDFVRVQLLILMVHYENKNESELMTCAEHYFKDLEGDWYMTPKFNRFIQEHDIAKPDWLD